MAVTKPARHPERSRPPMTSSHPLLAPCQWFSRLAAALDRRSAPRLALLFLGAVLARGRRTVTGWLRAAGRGSPRRKSRPRRSGKVAPPGRMTWMKSREVQHELKVSYPAYLP